MSYKYELAVFEKSITEDLVDKYDYHPEVSMYILKQAKEDKTDMFIWYEDE